jgi:hypothetical protein
MCALVQAIRKVGIVGGGPAIGDAAKPMHIVRTIGTGSSQSPSNRPPSSKGDTSFGQSRRIVEDPTTQVDDDRPAQSGYEYYEEYSLDRQLTGTTSINQIEEEALQRNNEDVVEMGKSFGRRRKQVPVDLEKGRLH